MAYTYYNKLPNGLHLINNEDGTASITGVPNDLPGYYKFAVRCEDSTLNSTIREFEIEVPWTDDFNIDSLSEYTLYSIGTPSIADGNLTFIGNSASSSLIYEDNDGNNVEVGCILSQAQDAGVIFGFEDNNNYYVATIYDNAGSPSNTVRLYKRTSGTYTQLASSTISFTRGTSHSYYVRIEEGIINAYFDGDLKYTYDTLNPELTGKFGLYSNVGTQIYHTFWYRPQNIIPFVESDYPQPPLELSINGYIPKGQAHAPYSSTTDVAIHGTGPFTVDIINGILPGDWTATVNGNHVEIVGTEPLLSGYYTFTIKVSDGVNTALLPVSVFLEQQEWRVGEVVNSTIPIAEGVGPYTGLTVDGGTPLPSGLSASIIDNNIVITGTPDDEIEYGYIEFTVTDSESETITVNVGYVVYSDPPLIYPYIQLKGKLPVWVIGSEVSGQFKITGGSGVYTDVELASGSTLPPNVIMTFDDNDTITFSGIVDINELPSIHTITLDITDTISTKQATFKVSVQNSNEIDLAPIGNLNPIWLLNYQLLQTIELTNGTLPYTNLELISGTLPDGVSITLNSPNLEINAEPTEEISSVLRYKITDSDDRFGYIDIDYSVGEIGITSDILPEYDLENVNIALNTTLTGTITWDIVEGTLPPGWTLGSSTTSSNTITGLATEYGHYVFMVSANDGANTVYLPVDVMIVSLGEYEFNLDEPWEEIEGYELDFDLDEPWGGGD